MKNKKLNNFFKPEDSKLYFKILVIYQNFKNLFFTFFIKSEAFLLRQLYLENSILINNKEIYLEIQKIIRYFITFLMYLIFTIQFCLGSFQYFAFWFHDNHQKLLYKIYIKILYYFQSYTYYTTNVLIIVVLPIIILIAVLLIPEKYKKILQNTAFIGSILIFYASYIVLFKQYVLIHSMYSFKNIVINIFKIAKYSTGYSWATDPYRECFFNEHITFHSLIRYKWSGLLNVVYSLGFDGISLYFILLTTFLTPLLILNCFKHINYMFKKLIILLLLTEFLLINVFLSTDLFFFYFFFESILIPMFLIIGIWGSRQRKIHAAYQFFFYTLLSSVLMLLALFYIYMKCGCTDIEFLRRFLFDNAIQNILWLCFMFSFVVKIPMFPFHIWLPEAHVEAPTVGSVLLAGLLLKMGTYGILRFVFLLFPTASYYFAPIIFVLGSLGIIYGSLTTIRQIDLKKIVAYSSVAHMNFVIVGLFSFNYLAIEGALLLMISHGLVSSAMFFSIGNLYERYKTRLLKYYGGLIQIMPMFGFFFIFFNLANMSFPGTNNFIGEFLILSGVFLNNVNLAIIISFNIVLSAVYTIWMVNRLLFGPVANFKIIGDLNLRELFIFAILSIFILYTGIKPQILIDSTKFAVQQTIEVMNDKLNLSRYLDHLKHELRKNPPGNQEFIERVKIMVREDADMSLIGPRYFPREQLSPRYLIDNYLSKENRDYLNFCLKGKQPINYYVFGLNKDDYIRYRIDPPTIDYPDEYFLDQKIKFFYSRNYEKVANPYEGIFDDPYDATNRANIREAYIYD